MWATPPAPSLAGTAPGLTQVACAPAYARERCGFLAVPLDRRHPNGRRIKIYFEQYLRRETARPRLSTVVSIEGGPGYSTTSDRDPRIAVWRPVNARRDLLLIDLRGTGRSHAILCPAFKHHITGYIARAGLCAQQLGPNRDLYDTAQSVQDMQAVLVALKAGKVDMYGDSYGSYAAQAFAVRYPHRLRSLVLDGTYQLKGADPEFRELAAASRRAFRLACRRGPNCPVKGSDPVAVLQRFVARVRAQPISGRTHDGDGTPVHVTVNEDSLVQTVMDAEAVPAVYRNLLGAVLSAERGDNRPLLRIVAENVTVDAPNGPKRDFSEALYAAVICHDYPQPWSASTPIAGRLTQALARIDSRPPAQFAPFSARAWTGTDYEGALACARWPSPARADPPVPANARYPDVPTLILNGDLDNITPLEDARPVARDFPRSTLVVVRNSVHVTVLDDQNECASVIYEHFVRTRSPGRHVVRRPGSGGTGGRPLPAAPANVVAATATAGRSLHAARSPHGGRRGGHRGRRRLRLVGQLLRRRGRPAGRHLVVHRQHPHRVSSLPDAAGAGRGGDRSGRLPGADGRGDRQHRGARRGEYAALRMRWSLNQRRGRATITGTAGARVLHLRCWPRDHPLPRTVFDQRRAGRAGAGAQGHRGRVGGDRLRRPQPGRAGLGSASGARAGGWRRGRDRLDADRPPPRGAPARSAAVSPVTRPELAEMLVFIDWFNRVWKVAPNAIEAELRAAAPDAARVDALGAEMAAALDLFEGLLTDRPYLMGERFSAADCAAFPFLKFAAGRPAGDDELFHVILEQHQPLGTNHPRLAAWLARVNTHPRA